MERRLVKWEGREGQEERSDALECSCELELYQVTGL